jgi:aerobic C4-dicarboxylate transport protein
MKNRSSHNSLTLQVIAAILLGVVLGLVAPATAVQMKPLGDGFIKLVAMIIAPIIFCTVVGGISGSGDIKRLGRAGGLALIYFEVVSTLSLIIGLIVVNTVRPGSGMNVDPHKLDASGLVNSGQKLTTVKDFLLNIIPQTVVDAFAKGEILQVLLLAVLFGIALQQLGERGKRVAQFIDDLSQVFFRIVGLIMVVAPIGAFGAMAYTVGSNGPRALLSMGKLMGTFYLCCAVFIFLVLGTITRAHGFSIWRFLRYIREELLIVLATSSSEAALPRMIDRMESLGAGAATVGLVIPTGYSFNLDGTSLYLTLAAMFIAQATNTAMTLTQQVTLLAVLMLTSKGAAGVTGSGFIVLGATLSAMGNLPVSGLALILGIDRLMSQARAITNVIGNGVATIVVAKWTGDLNEATLQDQLREGPGDDPGGEKRSQEEDLMPLTSQRKESI